MRTDTRLAAALLASLLIGALPAGAFVPVEGADPLTIARPGSEIPPVWRSVDLALQPNPGGVEFAARAGGSWASKWNALTGTPHSVLGSGLPYGSGPITTEQEAVELARRFVAENPWLGARAEEMDLRSAVHALGKWGVIFQQRHEGYEVEGGRLRVVFTDQGRIYYFGSDWHPGIALSGPALLDGPEAVATSMRMVSADPARDSGTPEGLRILPVPAGERLDYRLVWKTRVEVAQPYAIWITYLDARTGEALWRTNDVHYVNVVGTTAANVEDFGYCYGEFDRRMPNMKVNITGGNTGYSDLNGAFNISHPGNTPVTVTAQLDGRWINANNMQSADASFSGVATPGVPFEIRWTDGNSHDAERDVYLHGNRIHDLVKLYEPGWIPPDYRMSANVNINSNCNAYWNGSSINFYVAGGGCGNTGQMGDVIYHEYGHGITQWIYGSNPSDVGEGNSDIVAMLIDGNPIVGEGFYLNNCSSGIRTADNNLRYPDDYQAGQIHFNGQIISGFWWDAREILLPIHGEQGVRDLLWPIWHFSRRALEPTAMPDQVESAFIMDDDDGDLTNGTPHYFAFCPAAENHGFVPPGPVPAVAIAHQPLHNQVFDGNPDPVAATITSTEAAIDPASVKLHYQLNEGAPVELAMSPTGNPNEFAANIPAHPVGSAIDYTILARDLLGNGGAYPPAFCTPEEPSGRVRFYVATAVDEMEVPSGWTVGSPDDDATTGIWERIDPNGTAAQPEDDATPVPGVFAWITGQCVPGCGLGDNDIDGGKTTLTSPLYDLTGSTTAKVVYYRWYSNDAGATPGTDFWVVDASNNGGAAWSSVENTNVSDARWLPVEVDLNDLFGGAALSVRFRFVASDEGDGSLVEAGLDDFLLFVDFETVDTPQTEPAQGEPRFALHPVRPNPSGSGAQILFDLPSAAAVRMEVVDLSGRRVRTLAAGELSQAGRGSIHWDGSDHLGRPVPSGVYYLRMETEGFVARRKIVIQR